MKSLALFVLLSLALVSCGSGGDGGGGSIGNAAPLFALTGAWSGSYQLPTQTVSIVGTLTGSGNAYSGSFTTSLGATLNVSGQVSGSVLTIAISSTESGSCNGSFSGNGALSQPGALDTLTFSFSGADCHGSLSGIPGNVHRTGAPAHEATPMIAQRTSGEESTAFDVLAIDTASWIVDDVINLELIDRETGAIVGAVALSPKHVIPHDGDTKSIVFADPAGDPTTRWTLLIQ